MARYRMFREIYTVRGDGSVVSPSGREYRSLEEAESRRYYDESYVEVGGHWMHRTWLKCILNPFLRLIQLWRRDPYVLVSRTEFRGGKPYFMGYYLGRVIYDRRWYWVGGGIFYPTWSRNCGKI